MPNASSPVTDSDGPWDATAGPCATQDIHHSAASGHVSELARLLDQGAELSVLDDEGLAPLHLAARNGHLEALRFPPWRAAPTRPPPRQTDLPPCRLRLAPTKPPSSKSS